VNVARREYFLNGTLIALAVVLVLAVLFTRNAVTTDEREARTTNLLQVYREDEVTRIRFERKEGAFTLVRTKTDDAGIGTWSLKEPLVEDAEPFAVEKLLGTLEFASFVRKFKPEEANRAAFGLDDPVLVVHVDMGETKYRLRVGKEAASPKGAHYLEIAGEGAPEKGIVLVAKSLLDELDVKVDDFRERYVMPYLSTQLDRIVIEGEGGTRKLRRATWQDGWRFDGMLGDARLARLSLDRMLTQFARTRADRFIDATTAEESLSHAKGTVKITMVPSDKKSATGIVEVGGECPGNASEVVALRRQPDRVAACVPESVFSGLAMPADALVDRTLFWMRPDEVESLEVRQGEQRLALDRKETGFVMRAPEEGTVDAEAGNGRLDAILHAGGTIVSAPDRRKLGLDPPYGKVTVSSAAADDSKVKEESVALSAPSADGTVYAERLHDGAVLELRREAARALVADASLVRSRTILDVPLADVAGAEVTTEPHEVLERAESGTITLKTPHGFEADGAQSLELFDALRSLTADRWVSDRDDGTFGLDRPLASAKLRVRNKGEIVEHTLSIGRPTSSGYYAAISDSPGVFVVPRRTYETLTTLVLDRGVFLLEPSSTSRITLEAAGRTLVLERRGDEFVQTDPGDPLAPEAIQKIVDALASMRAESALSIGPDKPEYGLSRPVLAVSIERAAGVSDGKKQVYRVGSGDSYRGVSIHYARLDGIDATYALPRANVRSILDVL
jgi:hypothetical protein